MSDNILIVACAGFWIVIFVAGAIDSWLDDRYEKRKRKRKP